MPLTSFSRIRSLFASSRSYADDGAKEGKSVASFILAFSKSVVGSPAELLGATDGKCDPLGFEVPAGWRDGALDGLFREWKLSNVSVGAELLLTAELPSGVPLSDSLLSPKPSPIPSAMIAPIRRMAMQQSLRRLDALRVPALSLASSICGNEWLACSYSERIMVI